VTRTPRLSSEHAPSGIIAQAGGCSNDQLSGNHFQGFERPKVEPTGDDQVGAVLIGYGHDSVQEDGSVKITTGSKPEKVPPR